MKQPTTADRERADPPFRDPPRERALTDAKVLGCLADREESRAFVSVPVEPLEHDLGGARRARISRASSDSVRRNSLTASRPRVRERLEQPRRERHLEPGRTVCPAASSGAACGTEPGSVGRAALRGMFAQPGSRAASPLPFLELPGELDEPLDLFLVDASELAVGIRLFFPSAASAASASAPALMPSRTVRTARTAFCGSVLISISRVRVFPSRSKLIRIPVERRVPASRRSSPDRTLAVPGHPFFFFLSPSFTSAPSRSRSFRRGPRETVSRDLDHRGADQARLERQRTSVGCGSRRRRRETHRARPGTQARRRPPTSQSPPSSAAAQGLHRRTGRPRTGARTATSPTRSRSTPGEAGGSTGPAPPTSTSTRRSRSFAYAKPLTRARGRPRKARRWAASTSTLRKLGSAGRPAKAAWECLACIGRTS